MSEQISTVEQLVAAREARGLSFEDVLRQLKLAPRQLKALESGDWQALPGTAFTRAVLRSYGRVLGVDVEALLASFSQSVPSVDLRPTPSLDTPLPARSMLGFGSGGGGSRLAWAVLVLIAVVALALFFGGGADLSNVRSWLSELRGSPAPEVSGRDDSADGTKPRATTTETLPLGRGAEPTLQSSRSPESAAPPAAGDAPGAPAGAAGAQAPIPSGAPSGSAAPSASAPASGAPSVASAPVTAGQTPAAATPTAQVPAPPSVAAEGANRRTLKLRFERESWIEVRAGDGSVLVTGTQQPQTSREVSGAGPLSVVIGNAEFVRAEVDGKPFDLAPHTRGAIARLTLPAASDAR